MKDVHQCIFDGIFDGRSTCRICGRPNPAEIGDDFEHADPEVYLPKIYSAICGIKDQQPPEWLLWFIAFMLVLIYFTLVLK